MTVLPMKPSCRRVLERLRHGPATTHDLCQPDVGGVRFGGRIGELRELGFTISSDRVRQGSTQYTLTFDAERGRAECPTGQTTVPPGAPSGLVSLSAETPQQDASERAGGTTNPVPRESTATSWEGQPPVVGAASLFDPDAFAERGTYKDAA